MTLTSPWTLTWLLNQIWRHFDCRSCCYLLRCFAFEVPQSDVCLARKCGCWNLDGCHMEVRQFDYKPLLCMHHRKMLRFAWGTKRHVSVDKLSPCWCYQKSLLTFTKMTASPTDWSWSRRLISMQCCLIWHAGDIFSLLRLTCGKYLNISCKLKSLPQAPRPGCCQWSSGPSDNNVDWQWSVS